MPQQPNTYSRKRRITKRFVSVVWIVAGMFVVYLGVRELDNADTWLEFTKAILWIVVGVVAYQSGRAEWRELSQ